MALFRLTETEERSSMKSLFGYIHSKAVGSSGTLNHYCDSTWEHACRFLFHFDPQGKTDLGYSPTVTCSQAQHVIDVMSLTSLPSIEVFLDVALSMNNHFHGIGAKTLSDPMVFDQRLEPILRELELLDSDGMPTRPLLLDAIDRWHFFDWETNEPSIEVKAFLEEVAEDTWRTASQADRNYVLTSLKSGSLSLEGWFANRWRFGVWLSDDEIERSEGLFGSHSALSWLVVLYIEKNGLKEARYLT